MKLFQRGLFDSKTETKYFLPFFNKIEELNDIFLKMPNSDKISFISESVYEQWVKKKEIEKINATLIFEIYNRMKFLFYINTFKATKLIEALAMMYNSKNYLGWTLIGRSVIEHVAVFYYFQNKLQNINLLRTSYKINEIEELENILIRYITGSRFDWDTLLDGNIKNLTKDYKSC